MTQVQKSVLDFTRDRFRDNLKDEDGNDTDETVYRSNPEISLL